MLSSTRFCATRYRPSLPALSALKLEPHVRQAKCSTGRVSFYTSLERTTFVMVKSGGRLDRFDQNFKVLCTAFVYIFIRCKQLGSIERFLDSHPQLPYGDTLDSAILQSATNICLVQDSQARYTDNVVRRGKERGGQ